MLSSSTETCEKKKKKVCCVCDELSEAPNKEKDNNNQTRGQRSRRRKRDQGERLEEKEGGFAGKTTMVYRKGCKRLVNERKGFAKKEEEVCTRNKREAERGRQGALEQKTDNRRGFEVWEGRREV